MQSSRFYIQNNSFFYIFLHANLWTFSFSQEKHDFSIKIPTRTDVCLGVFFFHTTNTNVLNDTKFSFIQFFFDKMDVQTKLFTLVKENIWSAAFVPSQKRRPLLTSAGCSHILSWRGTRGDVCLPQNRFGCGQSDLGPH